MSVCKGRQGPLCPLAQCVQLSNCQRWSGRVTTWGLWTATHSYLIKPAARPPFIFAMDDDDEDDSSGRVGGGRRTSTEEPGSPPSQGSGLRAQTLERGSCFGIGDTGWQSLRLMLLFSWGQKTCSCRLSQKIGQWFLR